MVIRKQFCQIFYEGHTFSVIIPTGGYSGRVIRMLCQLVGVFSVERVIIKIDMKFYGFLKYLQMKPTAIHSKIISLHNKASTGATKYNE